MRARARQRGLTAVWVMSQQARTEPYFEAYCGFKELRIQLRDLIVLNRDRLERDHAIKSASLHARRLRRFYVQFLQIDERGESSIGHVRQVSVPQMERLQL